MNHETVRMKMYFIDNEENYQYYLGIYAGLRAALGKEAAVKKLSRMMENDMKRNNPIKKESSIYSELLAEALNNIDYAEIAEVIAEDFS